MAIRRLPETLINQIAAGEVVERPAAAVKELVENAIDAGARRIDVQVRDGGRTAITVIDDGSGMSADDLGLAVERHATSKLPEGDLMAVDTLGFRGEALPSIGAVSRLTLTSRQRGADSAWAITVEGGAVGAVVPASHPPGTRVEIRDLFYAVPARLKFLKAARTEQDHIEDVLQRLAMAHPEIAFSVTAGENGRPTLRYAAGEGDLQEVRLGRLAAVLGRDFGASAVPVAASRDGLSLTGFVGLPTFNRPTSREQYLYVNGRPVRDKLLFGAVRGAYGDLMPRDRHPALVLFLALPGSEVDVNVHPAKTEVRFRDGQSVRGLMVGGIRQALAGAGPAVAPSLAGSALLSLAPRPAPPATGASTGTGAGGERPGWSGAYRQPPPRLSRGLAETGFAWQAPLAPAGRPMTPQPGPDAAPPPEPGAFPLGVARAQLHATYIIAETADGVVLVDQHAAHERLVYEKLKAALLGGGGALPAQGLLMPEVVEVGDGGARRLLAHAEALARLGLGLESFGLGAVLVREVPALLGQTDVGALVRDLADQLAELDDAPALRDRLDAVCASIACHGSVRAGKLLAPEEMNALLRQMEAVPQAGQCSHGRPTWIELKRADIERLFERR
ncbi:MAG: DNA mismatch repair endonuclease MutL [Rhodospirillaceae bacterium]